MVHSIFFALILILSASPALGCSLAPIESDFEVALQKKPHLVVFWGKVDSVVKKPGQRGAIELDIVMKTRRWWVGKPQHIITV